MASGDGFIHPIVLVVGFLVLCHAVALPNEDALNKKIEKAESRIRCLEQELSRYQIDETYCGKPNRVRKIVGGYETEVNEYPWQVALVKRDSAKVFCGGSLINDRWVLTAAHCTQSEVARDSQIILGNHHQDRVDQSEIRLDIRTVVDHPHFNNTNLDNDFSLLELLSPLSLKIVMPEIMPVCLQRSGISSQYDNVSAIATGWGRTSSGGTQSNSLQEVSLNTMNNIQCNQLYSSKILPSKILPSMMCAERQNRDTCQGDSGGPLITEDCGSYYLIGITSWGKGCAEPGYPGVYARVTDALDWITRTASSKKNIATSSNTNNDLINSELKWHSVGPTDMFVRFEQQMSWTDARALCRTFSLNLYIPRDTLTVAKYLDEHFITSRFLGPYNKIWSDDQCKPLGNALGKSATECMTLCERTSGCTAVNHKIKPNTDCVLRACKQPIPFPEWDYSVHQYQGYSKHQDGGRDRYWIAGRGNGKHIVWTTGKGSEVSTDEPWYSNLNDQNVATKRCLTILTSGTYTDSGKVLSVGNCVDTTPYVLCG